MISAVFGKIQKKITTGLNVLMMRGQVFTIERIMIFTMGGAFSNDRKYRIEGESRWLEELPSYEEYEEAIKNLDENSWTIDLVLTHCAPASLQKELSAAYKENSLTAFLEEVRSKLSVVFRPLSY